MYDNQHKSPDESGVYSLTTNDITISVTPAHIIESSDPLNDVYAFSYNIKIHNLGKERVQLLERHWLIMSGGVQIAEVIGPGVIGAQPILEEGQAFEYSSGSVIHDPIGSMQGSYTFRNDDGEYFEVTIPKFDLIYPVVIH